jgi:hypothetical protein
MCRSRPRLRSSNRKKRCSVCREVASRFKDIGPTRVWLCATHFKENENGNEKEPIRDDQPKAA